MTRHNQRREVLKSTRPPLLSWVTTRGCGRRQSGHFVPGSGNPIDLGSVCWTVITRGQRPGLKPTGDVALLPPDSSRTHLDSNREFLDAHQPVNRRAAQSRHLLNLSASQQFFCHPQLLVLISARICGRKWFRPGRGTHATRAVRPVPHGREFHVLLVFDFEVVISPQHLHLRYLVV